jgi:SAM-dependent methyltransferase
LLSCFSVVRHEFNEKTETNLKEGSTPYREPPASAESAYEHLTAYGFALRYANGKVVADVGREGAGSRLLAETAESVTGLSDLPEASSTDSSSFDVVAAFGVAEDLAHPEELVKEAKRILKDDGVLIVSATDKQTNTNERNHRASDGRQEMYVSELRGLLECYFGHVRLYRQGAVAGGFIFPDTMKEPASAPVEVARFSLAEPRPGAGSPVTRSVIAVCSDSVEAVGGEEGSYLLLDRDRWVFDESEERAEDVELLRAEILRMQDSEVRAFVDALRREVLPLRVLLRLASQVLLSYLYGYWKANLQAMFRRREEITFEEARRRRELTLEEGRHRRNLVLEQARHRRNTVLEPILHRRNIIRGNIYAIRKKGPRGLVQGAFRRSYDLYRRLRNKDRGSEPNLRSKYERNQTGGVGTLNGDR